MEVTSCIEFAYIYSRHITDEINIEGLKLHITMVRLNRCKSLPWNGGRNKVALQRRLSTLSANGNVEKYVSSHFIDAKANVAQFLMDYVRFYSLYNLMHSIFLICAVSRRFIVLFSYQIAD